MANENKKPVIAIAGNPNSGKTTLFNALTGSHQRVGNWPGVTVEKKTGEMRLDTRVVEIVDLPGIYSLSSHSEDEKVARDYLLSGEAGIVIDIVDASNLERNLFLTLNLLEMKVPTLIVLNMIDLAEKKGAHVDVEALSRALGTKVLAMSATSKSDVERFRKECDEAIDSLVASQVRVAYPYSIEKRLADWNAKVSSIAVETNTDARWISLKLLEQDQFITGKITSLGAVSEGEIGSVIADIEKTTGDTPDAVIASAKYDFISDSVRKSVSGAKATRPAGEKLDKVILNRFLGIPIFILVMYLMFWFVINVGGAFIDFFDILFGAVFVDGFGLLLESIGSPSWLVALLANGIGAGIQTVSTFVPIMFMMFFVLSLLEDSGYMARAAFVMDRALRAIGLPGKAFIPMIVGFGCSVPAIMATRTLENKRDRYLTVFMAPFMSCGARLPLYALFGAAFFGRNAQLVVLSIYLAGILLAIGTGFLLKNTLFKGEPAPFVMELPPYHVPRFGSMLRGTWTRLKVFLGRAGKVIVLVVAILGVLNTIGTDGSFGNEDSEKSVLATVGRSITPIFKPMGLTEKNWPATVGMFTGLFAKEAVVGTLNGLYGQLEALDANAAESASSDAIESEAPAEPEEQWSFAGSVVEAFASIPEAFAGLGGTLADPVGASIISDDETAVAEEIEADQGIFAVMRSYFNNDVHAAYAYLLFVLIYFPCIAALGAIIRELGSLFGWICVGYLTVLAWVTATLYYQIAAAHQIVWIVIPLALLAAMIAGFSVLRKKVKIV